jgi:hypothetical protein
MLCFHCPSLQQGVVCSPTVDYTVRSRPAKQGKGKRSYAKPERRKIDATPKVAGEFHISRNPASTSWSGLHDLTPVEVLRQKSKKVGDYLFCKVAQYSQCTLLLTAKRNNQAPTFCFEHIFNFGLGRPLCFSFVSVRLAQVTTKICGRENGGETFRGEVQPEVPGSGFGPTDSSDCGQFVSREFQIAHDGRITFGPESFSHGESHMASYLALFGSPIEEDVVVMGLSGIFHSTSSAKVSTFWACAFQVLETEDSVLARVVKRAPFTIMGAEMDTEHHVTFSPALVVARGQFLGYMSTTGQIHCQVQYTASPETILFASPCAPGQEAADRAMSGRPIRLKICHCTLFLRWEMLSKAQVRATFDLDSRSSAEA